MQRQGLVFDALVRPVHLSRLLVLADRCPDLTIVVDHGGKPDIRQRAQEPWASDLLALARRPNVVVKLSGLLTEANPGEGLYHLYPFTRTILEAFGPERVLFGSDLAGAQPCQQLWRLAGYCRTHHWRPVCRGTGGDHGGQCRRIYLSNRGRR